MSALQLFVMDASGFGVPFRIMTPCGPHSAAIGLVIRLHLGDILVNRTTDYGTEGNRKNPFEFLVSGLSFGLKSLSRAFEFGVLDLVRVLSLGEEALGCDPFSRVGACGRRPSESADPRGWRAGGCRRSSAKGSKS